MENNYSGLFEPDLVLGSIKNSFKMLTPHVQYRNPVMFVTYIGAIITTIIVLFEIFNFSISWFDIQITIWLWFTVLFANYAESVAESRGKRKQPA